MTDARCRTGGRPHRRGGHSHRRPRRGRRRRLRGVSVRGSRGGDAETTAAGALDAQGRGVVHPYRSRGVRRQSGTSCVLPLYPLVVRAVSFVTLGNYWLAGWPSRGVLRGRHGAALPLDGERGEPPCRGRTVVLISVFPTAFVFSAIYSESLFLLFTVAAFSFARRRHWVAACIAGCLATLTRRAASCSWCRCCSCSQTNRAGRRAALPSLGRMMSGSAWLLLVPSGLIAYMAYLWVKLGDPTRFIEVQRIHWHRTTTWPWVDVWRGARGAARGVGADLWRPVAAALRSAAWGAARSPVRADGAPVRRAAVRRLLLDPGVPTASSPLRRLLRACPSRATPGALEARALYSYHRFVLVVFPLFMGLGVVLEKRTKLFWIWPRCRSS